jgi:hypothetical protein
MLDHGWGSEELSNQHRKECRPGNVKDIGRTDMLNQPARAGPSDDAEAEPGVIRIICEAIGNNGDVELLIWMRLSPLREATSKRSCDRLDSTHSREPRMGIKK